MGDPGPGLPRDPKGPAFNSIAIGPPFSSTISSLPLRAGHPDGRLKHCCLQRHSHQVDARDGLKNGTVSQARFSSVGYGERVRPMVMRLRKNCSAAVVGIGTRHSQQIKQDRKDAKPEGLTQRNASVFSSG